MCWPFKRKKEEEPIIDPKRQLEALEKSMNILEERHRRKEITDQAYAKIYGDLAAKMDKCRSKINE